MTSSNISVWNGWTMSRRLPSGVNSDFQEAFEEKCPHIQPVFDYFHIVKNFNDKVVSEIGGTNSAGFTMRATSKARAS